ncbi:MAG: 4Fe-4S binding protein [Deltaproteobacteria bacterium]|nr:4Fe-4S binding protein [Deltaproteobacteria bacterium]
MLGQTIFLGGALAFAYRFLRVEEDPRIDQVEGKLPGSNCGACGRPGCRAFAEALVNREAAPGGCTVSPPDRIAAIAAFLGVEAGIQDKRVARLHCAGGKSSVRTIATYSGAESCRAAHLVNAGARACAFGCLGLGDCERACSFKAIRMNPEDLPVVDVDLCTACNDCVEVCPLDLFTLEPLAQKLIVQCKTPVTGERARAACAVACDACGRCALDAGPGVIEMRAGLPVIREPKRTSEAATFRCPTGAIRWVSGGQFQEAPAAGLKKHE